MNDQGDGIGRKVVDSYLVVGGGTARGYYLIFFYLCFCLLFSHVLSVFKLAEHDSCCLCFFVYYFFSLSPVSSSRGYWGTEIVVSVI